MKKVRYLAILIAVIVVAAVVYGVIMIFGNTKDKSVCAGVPEDQRDSCCVNNRPSVYVTSCNGAWKFNSTTRACYFACSGERTFCTADVKQCPDGSFVGRDADNNCEFKACPL